MESRKLSAVSVFGMIRMKHLFFLFLGALSLGAHAQNVTVTSSAEMPLEATTGSWKRALGSDQNGYYLLRERGDISNMFTVVDCYNQQLKLVRSIEIPGSSGTFADGKLHLQTELNKGRILTFHDRWTKADKSTYFSVIPYGMDGVAGEEKQLDSEPAESQMKSANYRISLSPDGSKLLVMTERPFEKGGLEKLRLKVFSTDNFDVLWSKDLNLDTESERYPNNNILVDNQGNAFIFKDIKVTNKEHIYQLITTNGEGSKTQGIDLKTYFPAYYKMVFDAQGKMVIGGMLATAGSSATNWERLWILKADATGILSNNINPLGTDLLMAQLSEKSAAQPDAKLSDFVLKDVLAKPEGGIILLAEHTKSTSSVIGTAMPAVYEYDMQYGGIIAISTNNEGVEQWHRYYDKKQSERTRDQKLHYGSFAYQLKGGQLFLAWNFTDLHNDAPIHNFRYWFDMNGNKINIDNLFGKEAFYPTLLTVINADGSLVYTDRTFASLPLDDIQKPNAFPMAIDPSFFFPTENGIVVLSRMNGVPCKRYKFNTIAF